MLALPMFVSFDLNSIYRQFDEPHYKVPISPPKPVKANDLHGICRKPIPRPRKIKALKGNNYYIYL